jgi:hypothetical protein
MIAKPLPPSFHRYDYGQNIITFRGLLTGGYREFEHLGKHYSPIVKATTRFKDEQLLSMEVTPIAVIETFHG